MEIIHLKQLNSVQTAMLIQNIVDSCMYYEVMLSRCEKHKNIIKMNQGPKATLNADHICMYVSRLK